MGGCPECSLGYLLKFQPTSRADLSGAARDVFRGCVEIIPISERNLQLYLRYVVVGSNIGARIGLRKWVIDIGFRSL